MYGGDSIADVTILGQQRTEVMKINTKHRSYAGAGTIIMALQLSHPSVVVEELGMVNWNWLVQERNVGNVLQVQTAALETGGDSTVNYAVNL